MPAPRRLRVMLGNIRVSAYLIEGFKGGPGERPTCGACEPVRTGMVCVADIDLSGIVGQTPYQIYQCRRCHAFWAVARPLQKEVEK